MLCRHSIPEVELGPIWKEPVTICGVSSHLIISLPLLSIANNLETIKKMIWLSHILFFGKKMNVIMPTFICRHDDG
jgi:hypothetical protein